MTHTRTLYRHRTTTKSLATTFIIPSIFKDKCLITVTDCLYEPVLYGCVCYTYQGDLSRIEVEQQWPLSRGRHFKLISLNENRFLIQISLILVLKGFSYQYSNIGSVKGFLSTPWYELMVAYITDAYMGTRPRWVKALFRFLSRRKQGWCHYQH